MTESHLPTERHAAEISEKMSYDEMVMPVLLHMRKKVSVMWYT